MKTTIKQFEVFKAKFIEMQRELGLIQYCVYFFHGATDENKSYAEIEVNEMGKVASVTMCKDIKDTDLAKRFNPEKHAVHECLHLASHRLAWLGRQRYLENSDLDEEWEALTRRFEAFLGW